MRVVPTSPSSASGTPGAAMSDAEFEELL